MKATETEIAVRSGDLLGECPVWLADEQALAWIDGTAGRIHTLNPSSGAVRHLDAGQTVGSIAPAPSGPMVAALAHDFVLIDRRTGDRSVLASVETDMPGNRLNDGKCDSRGRFWAGSWTVALTPDAALYRLSDAALDHVLAPVTCSNGIGWSPDDRLMYYVDSTTYRVDVFDFDAESGEIRNRRPLVEVAESTGMPDGLTVDADGCVWLGLWGGSAIHRYDPAGRLDVVIELPTANVTSCTFGGKDLRDLYITTAREELDEPALAAQPEAGSLFVCRPGPAGLPANAFAARTDG